MDSTANNAQPNAKPSSTTPVSAFSVGATKGAATRTAPTIRPVAIETAMRARILLLDIRGGLGPRSMWSVGVLVTASFRGADLPQQG
jgi:hypothetical protein